MGCGHTIDTDAPTTYQQVQGWARNRTQGGTNAIALRIPLPQWACNVCIDKLTNGIAIEQGEMFA
jgi:hypothetical protein